MLNSYEIYYLRNNKNGKQEEKAIKMYAESEEEVLKSFEEIYIKNHPDIKLLSVSPMLV